ncbi:MAG TPA: DNA polymerase III subunit delta [Steroidobacteraceae bacterium]|nr:DNA polymerase III subunit delta [Steroidobacteraceae bacterium]
MKLNADSLASQLRERLLPVYLISGDEPLLTGEAADAVRERARAAGFSEREVYFPERGPDWEELRGAARALSLFGARRVLEIRLSSPRPGTAGNAALVSLLEAPGSDTLFLILSPRLDRDMQGAEWVRSAEQQGAWVPVWPVDPARLVAWLRERARRLGIEASDAALELLAERTEGNLLAAHQELGKLALLAGSAPVTPATVLASVADSARFDVLQLADAALAGEPARALRVLAGLRAEGTEPTLVLWALTRALHDAWRTLGTGAAAAARGWSPRGAALAQAQRRAPRLPFAPLTARAARTDRIIKGRLPGSAWDELALLTRALCD